MNLTRFKLGHLGLAAAAAFAVSSAAAAPVNSWDYSVSSAFTLDPSKTVFGAASGGAPNTGGGTTSVSASQISWGGGGAVGTGNGANRSALTISNSPAAGTGVELGQLNMANTYSHTNNTNLPFSDPKVLRATEIDAAITLTSTLGTIGPVTATYKVKFRETTNTAAGCPTPGVGAPCADLFVLDGSTDFSFNGGDGYLYTVTFTSQPALDLLGGPDNNAAACFAAGAPTGCLGYVTAENAITDVQFFFTINATEIPEPASIALLGVGLLGLAGIRRRQQKNKA